MVGIDDRFDEVTLILAPHCHGHVCVLDPVTRTAWLSTEYSPVTRAKALCLAVEQLGDAVRRTTLHLVPDLDPRLAHAP